MVMMSSQPDSRYTEEDEKFGNDVDTLSFKFEGFSILRLPQSWRDLQDFILIHENITIFPKNMKRLYLCFGSISIIPDELGHFINLIELDLSINRIEIIPDSLGNLVNLKKLILDNNKIKIIPDSLSNLINLQVLHLSYNKIKNIPNSFSKLKNLYVLNLAYNEICDFPIVLCSVSQLAILLLPHNNINFIPVAIIQLRNLQMFSYDSYKIETMHETVQRFIMRIYANSTHRIYKDAQNVHNSSIQKSIKDSIVKILSYDYESAQT